LLNFRLEFPKNSLNQAGCNAISGKNMGKLTVQGRLTPPGAAGMLNVTHV
jgi:hypothetical protein